MSLRKNWKRDPLGVILWIALLLFLALSLTGPILAVFL